MTKNNEGSGRFQSQQRSIKIHISELKIGMFISKLDRDWLETPFLIQGFLVETLDDIDIVAEYCEHVWIDSVQEEWVSSEDRFSSDYRAPKKVNYINKLPAQDEHRQAMGVYREARRLTKGILDTVALQGVINSEEAKSTVKDCVDSIIRNPSALAWMSRVRESDEYTAEHCLNVCIYAISFGRHLGMEEEALHTLGLCGLLHDVGKMRVPSNIINKPGKLTDKEFKMIKAHTVHGRNLLMSSSGVPASAVDVAYGHHERMDGKGYPRKIKASGTSDYARIVAIVDAYDAMTAERCYAPAMPSTEALKVIFKDRATHFDERLAIEFIKCIGLYPPGTLVELENGCVGIVLSENKHHNRLPKIIVVLNGDKEPCKERIRDLADINAGELGEDFMIARGLIDGSHGITIKEYREKGLLFGSK